MDKINKIKLAYKRKAALKHKALDVVRENIIADLLKDLSYTDVGYIMNISRQRVHQIYQKRFPHGKGFDKITKKKIYFN